MKNKLSDNDFFDLYCKSANIVFNHGDNEVAFIKNKDLKYCYTSPAYLASFRPDGVTADYSDAESSITKDNEEHTALLNEFAKQDELVKSTLKSHNFIFVNKRLTLVRKSPIINPATGSFVGIVGTARPYQHPHFLELTYKISGKSFGLANSVVNEPLIYKLSPRLHLVLFLCINKYSCGEIADIISRLSSKISTSRVNNYLENLKYIFQARSKEDLIEKAVNLKYHRYIPRQLIKTGSFIIDDEVIISD